VIAFARVTRHPAPRFATRIRSLAAALLLALAAACSPAPPHGDVRASLLFVGDAGADPGNSRHLAQLRDVARAMAAEDRERPADGLLFLGDNFYPRGLLEAELATRMRETLAGPWCRFVAPGAPRAAELAPACSLPDAERHPIPIHAVLGNHDVASPESPRLERDAIPLFVPNWRLAAVPVEVRELPGGVSLVLVDSEHVYAGGDTAPLVDALRRAAGPWRVVALHRPVFGLAPSQNEDPADVAAYARRMREALAGAGVPVHLVLAGHEHSLQVLLARPPDPPLHVIAGSASNPRWLRGNDPHRVVGVEAAGFARLDAVGEGASARLVATLYRVLPPPLGRWSGRRIGVARFAVDLAGHATPE
jgi:hypothetical protein